MQNAPDELSAEELEGVAGGGTAVEPDLVEALADSLHAVETTPTFSVVSRERLFPTTAYAPPSGRHQTYDVDLDDQRLVMCRIEYSGGSNLYMVANWLTELRERVAGN